MPIRHNDDEEQVLRLSSLLPSFSSYVPHGRTLAPSPFRSGAAANSLSMPPTISPTRTHHDGSQQPELAQSKTPKNVTNAANHISDVAGRGSSDP
jgi:hypothetical protein